MRKSLLLVAIVALALPSCESGGGTSRTATDRQQSKSLWTDSTSGNFDGKYAPGQTKSDLGR